MAASVLACAIVLTAAAPVPPDRPNLAPPPRPVKPDVSMLLYERTTGTPARYRLNRVGLRAGRVLVTEPVCEGDEDFLGAAGWDHLVADRFLVTRFAGVVDVRDGKVLNGERDGHVERVEPARVVYRILGPKRQSGWFAFEYATGALTKIDAPPRPWHRDLPFGSVVAGDGRHAVEWHRGELLLHREGAEPRSLGKGFDAESPPPPPGLMSPIGEYPMLWLTDGRLLTQRASGRLVTVDLDGTVADVVTIKGVPKVANVSFRRDGNGVVTCSTQGVRYRIDVAKKTAEPTTWWGVGHGFEVSDERNDRGEYVFRYEGEEIGRYRCQGFAVSAAPGYLAVPFDRGGDGPSPRPEGVAVWSAASGGWVILKSAGLGHGPIIGWLK